MYRVEHNNVLAIPKGDITVIPVEVVFTQFPENYKIILDQNDKLFFGIMEPNHSFDEAIIKKEYQVDSITPDGYLNILIRPEDTACIDPGTYYWSVKVLYTLSEGDTRITTLVDRSKMIITD